MLSWYDLLGVEGDADEADIRNAYRRRVRALHPDRFAGDPAGSAMAGQMTVLLNTAWATLGSAAARARYDAELRSPAGPTAATARAGARPTAHPAGPDRGRPAPTDRPPPARGATSTGAGPTGRGATSTGRAGTREDLLARAFSDAEDRVLRVERVYTRPELAALTVAVRTAARPYLERFRVVLEKAAASAETAAGHPDRTARAGLPARAAAMAVAAGWRDVAEDDHRLRVEQRRVTRALVSAAMDSLGVGGVGVDTDADADGTSWVEYRTAPTGAPGQPAARWRLGRREPPPAPPAEPVLHLDDVDRVRFAAGRHLARLPETPPHRQPAAAGSTGSGSSRTAPPAGRATPGR